jgi:hypothetical protein
MDFNAIISHINHTLAPCKFDDPQTKKTIKKSLQQLKRLYNNRQTEISPNNQFQSLQTSTIKTQEMLTEVMTIIKTHAQDIKQLQRQQNAPTAQTPKPSFVNALKSTPIIIKPTTPNGQHGKETFSTICSSINPSALDSYSTFKSGSVRLMVRNPQEAAKIHSAIAKNTTVTSKVIHKLRPRMSIANINPDIHEEKCNIHELLDKIKLQSKILTDKSSEDIKAVALLWPKPPSTKKFGRLIVEVSPAMYKVLISEKSLHFDYHVHQIYDSIHIRQCRKCGDFRHKSEDCPGATLGQTPKQDAQGRPIRVQCCLHCSQKTHSADDCTSPKKMCINCLDRNKKSGPSSQVQTNHSAGSHDCPCYQDRLKFESSKRDHGN